METVLKLSELFRGKRVDQILILISSPTMEYVDISIDQKRRIIEGELSRHWNCCTVFLRVGVECNQFATRENHNAMLIGSTHSLVIWFEVVWIWNRLLHGIGAAVKLDHSCFPVIRH